MKKQILALCDSEAEYTRRFCEYVGKKGDIPFEVAAFTSKEKLEEFCKEEEVELLLMSESTYDISLKEIVKGDVIMLRDTEYASPGNKESIYKYQTCEGVLREVMNYCVNVIPGNTIAHKVSRSVDIKMIGLYSPVHRTLQTTLALTMGEILAREHKTLYLNFESYAGFEERMHKRYSSDMSDLLYFVSNAREALYYKLKAMTQKLRWLDYIPPAFSYTDICRVEASQWFDFFKEIEVQSDYEYLILDLSDGMQGLFDIMRACIKVFTFIREDGAALGKLYHYEKLLEKMEYSDINDRTSKVKVPLIRNLSEDPMEYTHTQLADIARNLLGDILEDDGNTNAEKL